MITVQLVFQDHTVSDTIAAANSQGMSFNDYIEWRLNVDLDTAAEQALPTAQPDESVENLVNELYRTALAEPAEDDSDEEHVIKAKSYLVEELYKRLATGNPWNLRDRGNRIRIGKAFKRLIDAQGKRGRQLEDGGPAMQVRYLGKNSQNQAMYKTVRVS
jgi:hypothetical protein